MIMEVLLKMVACLELWRPCNSEADRLGMSSASQLGAASQPHCNLLLTLSAGCWRLGQSLQVLPSQVSTRHGNSTPEDPRSAFTLRRGLSNYSPRLVDLAKTVLGTELRADEAAPHNCAADAAAAMALTQHAMTHGCQEPLQPPHIKVNPQLFLMVVARPSKADHTRADHWVRRGLHAGSQAFNCCRMRS